jgi:hypothetical protein
VEITDIINEALEYASFSITGGMRDIYKLLMVKLL